MDTARSALDRAIEAAGGAAALGKLLNLHRSAVTHWRRTRVPAERIWAVEAATGVPAQQLRPDLFHAADDIARAQRNPQHDVVSAA